MFIAKTGFTTVDCTFNVGDEVPEEIAKMFSKFVKEVDTTEEQVDTTEEQVDTTEELMLTDISSDVEVTTEENPGLFNKIFGK